MGFSYGIKEQISTNNIVHKNIYKIALVYNNIMS